MTTPLTLTPQTARRLFLTQQQLAGPRPTDMLALVRALGCLQIDPIRVVERPQYLIPFSRLGPYAPEKLDTLLWRDQQLFEYWAHCASIVLVEDYPLYAPMMRAYPWSDRTKDWIAQNEKLKRYVLREIKQRGPVLSRALTEDGVHPEAWVSTGWTSGRNLSRMLDFLWIGGKIMVAGRDGIQKKWDLSERVLPTWTPREKLSEREVTRRAVERALHSLGVATPRQIQFHFLRGRYAELPTVLARLEKEGRVQRVAIKDAHTTWPGAWYMHTAEAERLSQNGWQPRTTLLSPFDPLICDRARTAQMFGYDFRIEIYVPKPKRKYGYYVLSVLHGEQLIGRIDPEMDREAETLTINAVYAEPGAPKEAGPAVANAVAELATFLGARQVIYQKQRLPAAWKKALLA